MGPKCLLNGKIGNRKNGEFYLKVENSEFWKIFSSKKHYF